MKLVAFAQDGRGRRLGALEGDTIVDVAEVTGVDESPRTDHATAAGIGELTGAAQ